MHNYRPGSGLQTLITSSDVPFCEFVLFTNMRPTAARNTFSIFSTFHVDASVLNSCFVPNTGLSVRVLIDTWAFQIRTLVRDLCTIIVLGQNCKHSWQHRMCFLCINRSPKHSRAGQRGPNPAKSKPGATKISLDQANTISDQSKTSQDQVVNCSNQQISRQFIPSS